MPFRVREILLVSSAYDAFVLEEDGSLSDRLFYEYSELNLSSAPRLTHAASLDRALQLLGQRTFDLVITVVRVGPTDAADIASAVKTLAPNLPVALLIFDDADLTLFADALPPATIDHVFQWLGDASVLIAAIKLIEDERNVSHDTSMAGVQVLLVVEDRIRSYSTFLGLLYPELLSHAGSLIAEGLNDFHRLMRMRARPKILLANDYDTAVRLFNRHGGHICSLMSDVRMPREGKTAPHGGIELARYIREYNPDLPILFQTAEQDVKEQADELFAWFVNKNDHNFQARVRGFLKEALGFGDFIFRLPDRTEVARARDMYEMEQVLDSVPISSIEYHASRNHFSVWLMARSMFQLAQSIRPRTLAEFESVEELRSDLINVLRRARLEDQEGVITDLSSRHTGPLNRFIRIGRGSIGGKGRGVAFVSTQIVRKGLLHRFENLQIRIPKTVAVGTDAFDGFMQQMDIEELIAAPSNEQVTRRMLQGHFSKELQRDLRRAYDALQGPIAVRSSSLLEDSRFHPFAGVYATYMLPNNHPDRDVGFSHLKQAIKAVYASAFWTEARSYLAGTPDEPDEQRMAVVIQQVIGQRFDERFYPHASGVAQSYNYYPVDSQQPSDGVAHIALGLGHTVVGGGVSLRFTPATPNVLPQFPDAESYLKGTQTGFYAVNLARPDISLLDAPESSLIWSDLATAERDGTLRHAGSVYCVQDDVIRENLALAGPRVVSFSNILKWGSVPLAEALSHLLELLRKGVGEEVEVEFALDLGKTSPETNRLPRTARLYVVQVRPMTSPEQRSLQVDLERLEREQFFCRTCQALGHGSVENIRDVVYVPRSELDATVGRELVRSLRSLCARLREQKRPFVLVGPGRWGSSDPGLGIGVSWGDIVGVRVAIELPLRGARHFEPSQGTHFFRNITAAKVGYLTIEDHAQESWIDREWLDTMWRHSEQQQLGLPTACDELRHVHLEEPLGVHLDGRQGIASILKSAGSLRS